MVQIKHEIDKVLHSKFKSICALKMTTQEKEIYKLIKNFVENEEKN